MPQARKLLNEVMLAHFHEVGETSDLVIAEAHLARPPAAGSAALALVKNRHDRELPIFSGAPMSYLQINVKSFQPSNHSNDENRARVSSPYPGMRQFRSTHFRVEQMPQTKCYCNGVR